LPFVWSAGKDKQNACSDVQPDTEFTFGAAYDPEYSIRWSSRRFYLKRYLMRCWTKNEKRLPIFVIIQLLK
jgi:hypothetical protein